MLGKTHILPSRIFQERNSHLHMYEDKTKKKIKEVSRQEQINIVWEFRRGMLEDQGGHSGEGGT